MAAAAANSKIDTQHHGAFQQQRRPPQLPSPMSMLPAAPSKAAVFDREAVPHKRKNFGGKGASYANRRQ